MTASPLALDRALVLVRRALQLSTLALQPAGTAVPSQRHANGYLLAVPIRVGDAVHVLTAEADRPFDEGMAETLVELARLFAGLADTAPQAVLDLEADRAQIAAELDVVADALVTAKHAASDPAGVEAVEHALALLRRQQRRLRAHALEAGLASALQHCGFAVVGDVQRLADLPPAVAVVVQRVAEAVSSGPAGQPDERGQISAEVTDLAVKFRLDSADNIGDALELDRWGRRVRALGGELVVQPGGVELKFP